MARKQTAPPPPEPPREFRSPQEIDLAIAKLRRRIEELEKLDIAAAVISNTGADAAVQNNIRATISEVFGAGSPEHREHQHVRISDGGAYQKMQTREAIEAMKSGRTKVIDVLGDLISRLEEKRSNLAVGVTGGYDSTKSPVQPEGASTGPSARFDRLNLHPRICDVARETFLLGHYWEAVSDGVSALLNFVKERSGRHDLDGAALLRKVFSPIHPVLAFNGLATQAEVEEQEGMMHLFQGVVLAIRNRGGPFFAVDPEQRAIEYLSLLSLLAYRLQVATRRASR